MGWVSRDLEASEARRRVMELERVWRVRQVRDVVASSCGVSHGRTSSKHWKREGQLLRLDGGVSGGDWNCCGILSLNPMWVLPFCIFFDWLNVFFLLLTKDWNRVRVQSFKRYVN